VEGPKETDSQQHIKKNRLLAKLDAFLQFNELNILTHAGKVSHALAEEFADA
jgi:hypothetical protein